MGDNYIYDMNRNITNSQANVHIAHYTYNELGKLILRNLGYTGTAYLQNVDYRYNIRGQLLYINNSTLSYDAGKTNSDSNGADVFGMSIMYDQPDASISGVTANYTGRISAVKWMSENGSLATTNERSYAYSYDALNRYSGSIYAERMGGSGNFNVETGAFD